MFVGDPGSAGQFASNYFAAGERDNLTKQSQVRLQALGSGGRRNTGSFSFHR